MNAINKKWYVGAMNDALFIVNEPPRPSTDDVWHDRPDGPTLSIPVNGLSLKAAQEICAAHNSCIDAASLSLHAEPKE